MEQEKKKTNKIIIIINAIALIIIFAVLGYFIYDKYLKAKLGGFMGRGPGNFTNMSIEDICKNFQNRPSNTNRREFDTNRQIDTNRERPSGNQEQDFENIKEKMDIIQSICADGKITNEEKQQYEALN